MYVLVGLILAALAGCIQSSGVLKLGPDTYTASAAASPFKGGSTEARRIVLTQANEYCAQLGKEILVTKMDSSGTQAEITFRCTTKER